MTKTYLNQVAAYSAEAAVRDVRSYDKAFECNFEGAKVDEYMSGSKTVIRMENNGTMFTIVFNAKGQVIRESLSKTVTLFKFINLGYREFWKADYSYSDNKLAIA